MGQKQGKESAKSNGKADAKKAPVKTKSGVAAPTSMCNVNIKTICVCLTMMQCLP